MSSRGRGGGPAGASAGESVTTSVDEEWAEASASARLEDAAAGADARADTSLGASSAPRSDDATEASRLVDVTGASEGPALFKCKKCAKGSSCWPVHVATQKLSSLRKKALGRRGGDRGDADAVWDEFETLLEAGHRPTVKTYTALAAALGEMGAPEDCEDVLLRMREAGEEPDVKAYNVAVHAWCVGDDPAPREAMRLVGEMRARGVEPVAATFPPLVNALARLGATDEIESIIKSVESVSRETTRDEDAVLREYEKIYHAFIAGRLAADDPRDAEAVLRRWNLEKYDMERVADRKGRISRPVAASYGMIIDHYVRGGAMGEARRLLSQMQWDKVCPSIDIFNMLLRGYLALGNVGAAQDVFRELEGSGTWDMESLGIVPDVASYTSLMDHWAGQGDVVLAEKVLQKMEAKGVAPDDRAFGSLIKAYARARDPAGAEEVLTRMRAYDAPPERVAATRAGGRLKKSKRAAARPGGGFHPENPTASRSAEKYVGPKDEKKKMKPGVVLFSTVVSAYCAVGDMTNARRVVDEMRACPKSWRAAPNDRTFAHLAWGYGQLGDVAGVTATAGLMAEAGVSLRPNSEARKALVRACRECGLPAAHVDRMVENLGEAAPARRRAGERWVGRKKKSAAAAPAGSAKNAKDEGAKGAKSERPGAPATPTRKPTRAPPAAAPRRGEAHRSGDAGWVCSCVAGPERVRSVRVFANVSSRVSVGARGLTARRAHGAKGAGRVVLAAARAAVFA
uniref:Pentacotripeptide-repeat region of PRORP domain-containing protein n=1 Tax=Micromonas pusilla TaxID=38833 RepID=A0A7S0CVI9_MICPS|mmetsp:Transcript_13757/g.58805  ORF Transcript_13757/g.58805 Transcript_13757/m.58805 type:complete len:742 (+) Transcript_13757:15-2240(+)